MEEQREHIAPQQREFPFGPEWFEISQVTDRVWAIGEPFHTSENVRSYYIHGDRLDVLIDTGMGLADIRQVLPLKNNLLVLLTHTHWDHVGGAPDFPDVLVPDHSFEQDRARRGWQPSEMIEFERENFEDDHQPPESYSELTFSLPPIPENAIIPLQDGYTIDIGGLTIQAIATPGHTPGSMSFYIPELGYLFTGDTLYPGAEYIHMQESDPEAYYQSLEKLAEITARNLQIIFPGHNKNHVAPELLQRHIQALEGNLTPSGIVEGTDEFGPYRETQYEFEHEGYDRFDIRVRREH